VRSSVTSTRRRLAVALLAAALPTAGAAVLPLLALVGKQVVQDMVMGAVKSHLIGSLAGMGCKGARLAGLIATASAAHGAGGLRGLGAAAAGGMSPGGATMPAGMPGGMAMGSGQDMSQMFAAMGGAGMTPEQMARAQEAMALMQHAMEHPLTRPETLEVFAELEGLGLLTDAMHDEARDCILLAPPGSDRMLGQTGAIFKEVLLPQLRETKAKLSNLGPDEQDQLAQGIAEALREARPEDRKSFSEGLGLGFFPKAVVEKVGAAGR
jgi:hypothetical protein